MRAQVHALRARANTQMDLAKTLLVFKHDLEQIISFPIPTEASKVTHTSEVCFRGILSASFQQISVFYFTTPRAKSHESHCSDVNSGDRSVVFTFHIYMI